MKKVLVLVGLPASGKTTFAKDYYKLNNKIGRYSTKEYRINHIEFDELFQSYRYDKFEKHVAIQKIVNDNISSNYDEVILDGLFLTNEDVLKILNEVDNHCNMDNIEVHYWEPNVENCLWNDKYRRDENSEITIKNAKVEIPDIEEIKFEFNKTDVKVIIHEVQQRPLWREFVCKYDIQLDKDDKMKSGSWCLGGSYQTCWGNGGSVSADDQPTSYEEFDSLLEKVCPTITFLQYKKLYNACVSIGTYDEHDYYGGSTEHAYFICDIEKLYSELSEIGLITI